MNPWGFIETILDIIYFLSDWRFTLCLFGSVALALVVGASISAEPLRWIVAGVIVIAGIIVGWRWDSAH